MRDGARKVIFLIFIYTYSQISIILLGQLLFTIFLFGVFSLYLNVDE